MIKKLLKEAAFALLLTSGIYCVRCSPPAYMTDGLQPVEPLRIEPASQPVNGADLERLRAEDMFGIYIVTDCAEYRGSLPGIGDEAWARGQIGNTMTISRDLYSFNSASSAIVHKPKYVLHHYPELSQYEVPDNIHRQLLNSWGFGTDRKEVVTLEVRKSHQTPCEIIDRNTLWYSGGGGWVLQLRRKGTEENYVPVHRDY